MQEKQEGKEMATSTLYKKFSLNEEEVQKLISTPIKTIKESYIFNDIELNEKDRVAHATKIMASRKWK